MYAKALAVAAVVAVVAVAAPVTVTPIQATSAAIAVEGWPRHAPSRN